jgi:hypothetical protein
MASVGEVRDFKRRNCDKCGVKISGNRENFGTVYIRSSRSRNYNRYGSKDFRGRDMQPRARYICQDCWVDAKGKPLL